MIRLTLRFVLLSGCVGIKTFGDSGCFSGLLGGNIIGHFLSQILEISSNDGAGSRFFTLRDVQVSIMRTDLLQFVLLFHLVVIN
jgi:hypothetical protein